MINRIKVLSTILVAASTFANAQQVIKLEPFTQIIVRNTSNVTLKQADGYSIILPDNADISKLKYQVKNNALIIDGRSQTLSVTVKQIETIDVEGSGSLTVADTLHATNIEFSISGTGRLGALVIAESVKADISGAGNVALSGTANTIGIDISGSGRVNAEYLKVKNATASISGSGRATVDVTDNLTVNVSGSGSVYYKTKPATVNQSVSGVGQVGSMDCCNGSDTTHLKIGNMDIDISGNGRDGINFLNKPTKAAGSWGGVEIGYNGFATPDGYDFLELIPEKSVAVNLNLFDHDFKIYHRYVLVTTGLGLSYNNYRFRKNITLVPDTSTVWYTEDTLNYRKSKLTLTYLTVPIVFTFNTNELAKKAFHISTGVLFSYRIGSHTKRVYSIDGEKEKHKTFDDFNTNAYKCDATLRLGYRDVTVFASYALAPLFKSGQGPDVHPWTFGISLTAW